MPGRLPGVLALLLALVVGQVDEPTMSGPPAARLVYRPGAHAAVCPTAETLRSDVVARLGVDPFAEPAARIVVVALEGAGPRPAAAHVELFDAEGASQGVRRLEAREACDELVRAAALVVSIALDPAGALFQPEESAPAAAAPPPPVPLGPPDAVDGTVEAAIPGPEGGAGAPDGMTLLIGTGSQVVIGLADSDARGAHVEGALRLGAGSVQAGLRFDFPSALAPALIGASAVLTAGPCYHAPLFLVVAPASVVGARLCGTLSGGFASLPLGLRPYVGLGAQTALEWVMPDLSTFALWVQVEGALVGTGPGPPGETGLANAAAGATLRLAWPP